MTHYIADEDREGWITCDCGLHFPTRAKHDTHRHLVRVREALDEATQGDNTDG